MPADSNAQSARTQISTSGAWGVYYHPSGSYVAETTNESGSRFGLVCAVNGGACYWGVSPGSGCVGGTAYPVLMNARSGANTTTASCVTTDGNKGNIIELHAYDEIAAIVANDSRVGFALPIDGGQFKVVRFDLTGATEAAMKVVKLAAGHQKNSTRDLTL